MSNQNFTPQKPHRQSLIKRIVKTVKQELKQNMSNPAVSNGGQR